MVVCRYTCRHTREHQLYFIDRLVQNLFIYQRHKSQQQKKILNFSPHGSKPSSFLLIHLQPPQRLGPCRYFLLSASDFAGNQDSTLRGRFLVLHVSLLERQPSSETNCPLSLSIKQKKLQGCTGPVSGRQNTGKLHF